MDRPNLDPFRNHHPDVGRVRKPLGRVPVVTETPPIFIRL